MANAGRCQRGHPEEEAHPCSASSNTRTRTGCRAPPTWRRRAAGKVISRGPPTSARAQHGI